MLLVMVAVPDPPDITLPPLAAEYQSMVQPLGAVTEKVAVLVPQYALVLAPDGGFGEPETVIV